MELEPCMGQIFHQQIQSLKEKLPFGTLKQRKFTFTGIQLEQLPDFSIVASQQDYIHGIVPIEIGKHRRNTPEQDVCESEQSAFRALIGSMQYALIHTRPDLASKLGEVQIQLHNPKSVLSC